MRQIAKAAGAADPKLIRAEFRALRPVVDPTLRLERGVLARWADFATRIGILERKPAVDRAFAFGL